MNTYSTTHLEEIHEQFILNSEDQVSSYVNLNFPLEQIPEKYSILGIISSTSTSFEGILLNKDKIYISKIHDDDLANVNIILHKKYLSCIFETLDVWKKNNRVGILSINTV